MATEIINNKTIMHPNEEVGPPFKYLKAWELLSDLPKVFGASSITRSSTSGHSSKDENEKEELKVKKREKEVGKAQREEKAKEEHAT